MINIINKVFRNRSPVRLLAVTCTLTVFVLSWLGWNNYDSFRVSRLIAKRNIRITELQGRILHLDEILTMSARIAAATGDRRWEERYDTFGPQLDAALEEAKSLTAKTHRIGAATQTDTANIKLVEMENRAFDLVRGGRLDEAQAILSSDEYEKWKVDYSLGMSELRDDLERARAIHY